MKRIPLKIMCYIDMVLFAICQLFYCYPFIAESEIISGLPIEEIFLLGYIVLGILQIFISVATFVMFFGASCYENYIYGKKIKKE